MAFRHSGPWIIIVYLACNLNGINCLIYRKTKTTTSSRLTAAYQQLLADDMDTADAEPAPADHSAEDNALPDGSTSHRTDMDEAANEASVVVEPRPSTSTDTSASPVIPLLSTVKRVGRNISH